MDISVVIPLLNEEESLPELAAWIDRVMKENKFTYEIIFVDDGSKDQFLEGHRGTAGSESQRKGIKFRRNYGKAAALNVGFDAGTGRCGDHHGCRSAGQSRRDPGTVQDDHGRGI